MKKILPLGIILLFALLFVPAMSFAGEKQKLNIYDNATETQKKFIKEVTKLREKSNSDAEFHQALAKLGLKPEKTIVQKIKIDKINGKQVPILVEEQTYSGFYDISHEDVSIMGGTQSDLTLSCTVNRGYDELYGDAWISLDYKFVWSNCEEIDGTDDGWACNWDTEEAYCVGNGSDSDVPIVEEATGGMGLTTDDDNSVGKCWAMLTPRDGNPWEAHGELTQTYLHTYGFNSPTVSFSVNAGVVSVGIEGSTSENYWKKSWRGTY